MPQRQQKPRQTGLCMMMDKGLSLRQAEDIIQVAHHLIDFVKLGFGTSVVSNNVKDKVNLYHQAGIKVFLGGTLFEACLIRDSIDKYEKFADELQVDAVEISDGSMVVDHQKKCSLISYFAQHRLVVSEVGAKEAGVFTDSGLWIHHLKAELQAGSTYVIAEARESGNVGIYKRDGMADDDLIGQILREVPQDKIIWEAPLKQQQVWFIKQLGSQVNLGNITPSDVIPLETLRLGLRGDTFFDVLPDEYEKYRL